MAIRRLSSLQWVESMRSETKPWADASGENPVSTVVSTKTMNMSLRIVNIFSICKSTKKKLIQLSFFSGLSNLLFCKMLEISIGNYCMGIGLHEYEPLAHRAGPEGGRYSAS